MTVNFDEVVKLAEQLEPDEQDLLIYRLRVQQAHTRGHQPPQAEREAEHIPDEWAVKRGSEFVEYYRSPTREELIEDLENMVAAGTFKQPESLYGKYANPAVPDMTEEEFHAQMHALATEWEQELDDLDADTD
ncbi:MAG: hypothetical protein L6Q98_19635 [Anaerolineae bacterium]|nr:hypothetical protein [Anaerolineae bacterium]NUQ06462.1 hypothetical protein [Anaerolineae bacterium]